MCAGRADTMRGRREARAPRLGCEKPQWAREGPWKKVASEQEWHDFRTLICPATCWEAQVNSAGHPKVLQLEVAGKLCP